MPSPFGFPRRESNIAMESEKLTQINILVVDDEPDVRISVERSLQGFTVSVPQIISKIPVIVAHAETAEEAQDRIRTQNPDILLLDYKLPGMSGIELLDLLNETNDPPLVVMITAYASIETAIQATKKGAYDFLPKPFTPSEIRSTVHKAAEHLIISRQARALENERRQVRFQFISVLAHELKSPINAVEGFLNILSDPEMNLDSEERAELFSRSKYRIRFMRKMIADLLDLTRIESGQKKRELAEIDIRKIAKNVIENLQPDIKERKITVRLHASKPVILIADQDEIEIILNNLVSNAVKYNKIGGKASISVNADADDVHVSVADTGVGMEESDVERLFQDFVRIKTPQTRNIPGSGLGLSIVKKLVALYNGEIEVKSKPDEGTTFSIILRKTELDPSHQQI